MTEKVLNSQKPFELGLHNFVDSGTDPLTNKIKDPVQSIADLLEMIELADQLGLDAYALGEHHREEYLSSAPVVLLAAAAARTKNIRLSTAVTVLSSDDPVRVFQSFATLDLISNGRAEIMAGRGSFIESFPLFGYVLKDYGGLFDEKLRLLDQLGKSEKITWSGEFRSPIEDLGIYPRPVQNPMPIWVAVARFEPFFRIFREAAVEYGFDPNTIPLSINSHGYILEDAQEAVDTFYPYAEKMMNKIGKERGWAPANRQQLEQQRLLQGSDFVGTPDEVIEKILYQYDIFKHQRFSMYLGNNSIEHKKMMKSIELFGTKVAPVVRKEIASRNS